MKAQLSPESFGLVPTKTASLRLIHIQMHPLASCKWACNHVVASLILRGACFFLVFLHHRLFKEEFDPERVLMWRDSRPSSEAGFGYASRTKHTFWRWSPWKTADTLTSDCTGTHSGSWQSLQKAPHACWEFCTRTWQRCFKWLIVSIQATSAEVSVLSFLLRVWYILST